MTNSDLGKSDFNRLNAATDSAFAEVDHRYRERLCSLVKKALGKRFSHLEDPEDAVQSAMRSLFRGLDTKKFKIDHAGELWGLLATITRHKVQKHVETYLAGKRHPDKEVPGQAEVLPSRDPSPEEAAEAADLLSRLVDGLDPLDSDIVRLELQGFTREEIAREVGRTDGSVKHRIGKIREQLAVIIRDDFAC